MINKKTKKAGFNFTLLMLILAVIVFLVLFFIPRMLHSFGIGVKNAGSCESDLLGVETECRTECAGEWKDVPEGLISSDNCLIEEGYICCMKHES